MLLVFGLLIGYFFKHLGTYGEGLELFLEINPHGILLIFIPTIIFESSFNIDTFTFKREIVQILLLAFPGVAVGSFLLAIGFNYILGYYKEISFSGALTFASVVCATDPVAVVALLKELNAPLKFSVLLEGESLLNDGTAMVFLVMFSTIYKALDMTIIGIIIKFL